jgi:hypothetical protein
VKMLAGSFALWDVRDVEAFCRKILDRYLGSRGGRLNPTEYESALTFLVDRAWWLSGLEADLRSPRFVYWLTGAAFVEGELAPVEIGPFPTVEAAIARRQRWPWTTGWVSVEPEQRRPRGAYDPTRGLSFSTYATRILKNRVTDWYRDRFHDARYGDRPFEESYEGLLDALERSQNGSGAPESFLDRRGPGARADFIDDLNRHAYHDPTEEVLTRVASTIAR